MGCPSGVGSATLEQSEPEKGSEDNHADVSEHSRHETSTRSESGQTSTAQQTQDVPGTQSAVVQGKDHKSFAQIIFGSKSMSDLIGPVSKGAKSTTQSAPTSVSSLQSSIPPKTLDHINENRIAAPSLQQNSSLEGPPDRPSKSDPRAADIQKVLLDYPYLSLTDISGPPSSDIYLSYSAVKTFFDGFEKDKVDVEKFNLLRKFGRWKSPIARLELDETSSLSPDGLLEGLLQSVVYVCSTPEALLRSFVKHDGQAGEGVVSSCSIGEMTSAFKLLVGMGVDRPTLYSSLLSGLRAVYVYPTNPTKMTLSPLSDQSSNLTTSVNDLEAAHIIKIAFAALNASLPEMYEGLANYLFEYREVLIYGVARRGAGWIFTRDFVDELEGESAKSLATRLCNIIASRRYAARTALQRPAQCAEYHDASCDCLQIENLVARSILDDASMQQFKNMSKPEALTLRGGVLCKHFTAADRRPLREDDNGHKAVYEWVRSVLRRAWKSEAQLPRHGPVEGALELMRAMSELSVYDQVL